jgi:sulfatase maturation enzyme AslB (radical SAM superfamily)
MTAMHHIHNSNWQYTSNGNPRGYIQPQVLRELWFHTGTSCNLECPLCLEGAKPGDTRIDALTFQDARKYIEEALRFNVEKFCFTGGEPFVNKDIVRILGYALNYRPCLVLTNGTDPIIKRMSQVLSLKKKPHPLCLRVSLDYPDPQKHDEVRGIGNFHKALKVVGQLYQHEFQVSLARRQTPSENHIDVSNRYRPFLSSVGIESDLPIVVFPELFPPRSTPDIPQITEKCITNYKDEKSRSQFMCHYSKMVIKQNGQTSVFACTLVDDDPDFNLGKTLSESMPIRVMLKHHRCFACFSCGASCSE